MKTIKIFAVPSHQSVERTSGVDFVRIIQPMTYLNGFKDEDTEFKVTIFDKEDITERNLKWTEIAPEYDIIYLNYILNPWSFAEMGALVRKYGKKMIFDLDDSLWNIEKDNPAFKVWRTSPEHLKNFSLMCNEVDYITCTNLYLKHIITHHTLKPHEKIRIFPNYIDLKLYSHRSPFKNDLNIQLTHYGSTTHFVSLANEEFEKGLSMIFKEYPNVTFKTVGAFLPKYKKIFGQRYFNDFGHEDIYKWVKEKFPKFMDETDILVAPLTINTYNLAKSPVKWIESSSAEKVGCWQDIRQYQAVIRNGDNGFLCNRAEDWYRNIKFLIDNPEKRKEMGEQAFKDVVEEYQIQSHISDYAEFFKEVLAH
jgi:glycosyltransferase involved in cell wall biosynthesis